VLRQVIAVRPTLGEGAVKYPEFTPV
jgi:hypothetical protein